MPSSNILLFDANKANMMADEQYNTNTQRLNGVQSGIASSQLQNKTLYQVSLVAYAIAQIMNQNGLDANDTAAVSAFVANLSGTMLQKVADLATTQEAKAGVATGKWMSPALVRAAMDTYTSGKWLPLAGGTMTGKLILNTSSPTNALQAASKGYVDSKISNVQQNFVDFSSDTLNYIQLIGTYGGRIHSALGVTPSTVNLTLKAAKYNAVLEIDWSGTGDSIEFDYAEFNINGSYKRTYYLIFSNDMKIYPLDTGNGDLNLRYILHGNSFNFSLGTWVSASRLKGYWFIPFPVYYS